MSRSIGYLFVDAVNNAAEDDPRAGFKRNVEHHYKKFYSKKNVISYTGITAGFLVTTMGVIQSSLSKVLNEESLLTANTVLNALQVLVPAASVFIVSVANAAANKSNAELNRLISYGVRHNFFCKGAADRNVIIRVNPQENERDLELNPLQNQEDEFEYNENAIKYQLGLTL